MKRFRAKNFKWGEKLGRHYINVGAPEMLKSVVSRFCRKQKISVSNYILNLITNDLRTKDKKFNQFICEFERIEAMEEELANENNI